MTLQDAKSEWRRRLAVRRFRTGVTAAAILVVVGALFVALAGRRPAARRPTTALTGPQVAASAAPERLASLPIERWTPQIIALQQSGQWARLDEELQQLERDQTDVYQRFQMGYLHARSRLEHGDPDGAERALEPFLAPGHPWRDLALWHRARIADFRGDESSASRYRQELLFADGKPAHRDEALEDELVALENADVGAIQTFAARVKGDTEVARDLEARRVEALARTDPAAALEPGLLILRTKYSDDAGERVSRALDRPELLQRMSASDRLLVAESFREHRHFDRAIPLLREVVEQLPARRADLLYSLGRAYFGDEQYGEAEKVYLRGEAFSRNPEQKAVFLYHASRCAQLTGDDVRGEKYLGRSIAVGGSRPKTSSSITQRLRTRAHRGDFAGAEADYKLLRARFGKSRAVADGSMAYGAALANAGRGAQARRVYGAIPAKLLTKYEPSEIAYWVARTLEKADPAAAMRSYQEVLRAPVSTHFAWLTRERLQQPHLSAVVTPELARLRALVAERTAAGDFDGARPLQTDVVLLARDDKTERDRLRQIYQRIPTYRAIVDLTPAELPKLPIAAGTDGQLDRHDLLLALGLFDDAADQIPSRFPVSDPASALTRSHVLGLAGVTRGSIGAAETVMSSVPPDYPAELLPESLWALLYPSYFYDIIEEQSRKYGADPRLVLSIMREESRFNPRAKSPASARGLLQFIMSTARQVGTQVGMPDVRTGDLYDPQTIITLGSRYISDLSRDFGGDGYKVAAAYNAGPNQTRLWARLAPGTGPDAFITAVNFDETKDYVRKVQNSWRRYAEKHPHATAKQASP